MNVNTQTKTVSLSETDLRDGFSCPECGKFFKSNGTGPSNEPLITDALHDLPSEAICGGIPPQFHDCAYLLCPVGWVVEFNGTTAKDKASADEAYKALIIDQNAKRIQESFVPGLLRTMVYYLADRNYLFVHAFGASSYAHKH